jgi:hypothetical protein
MATKKKLAVTATKKKPAVAATKKKLAVVATTKKPAVAATKKKLAVAVTKKKPAVAATAKKPAVAATKKKVAVAATTKKPAVKATNKKSAVKATENTKEKEEAQDEAAPEGGPVIDSLGATIKKMLARGKERGYVTYDELNAALPQDQFSSEQIEDTRMRSPKTQPLVLPMPMVAKPRLAMNPGARNRLATKNTAAPTILFACTSVRWARWSCSRVKVKSKSPSASRPAVRK